MLFFHVCFLKGYFLFFVLRCSPKPYLKASYHWLLHYISSLQIFWSLRFQATQRELILGREKQRAQEVLEKQSPRRARQPSAAQFVVQKVAGLLGAVLVCGWQKAAAEAGQKKPPSALPEGPPQPRGPGCLCDAGGRWVGGYVPNVRFQHFSEIYEYTFAPLQIQNLQILIYFHFIPPGEFFEVMGEVVSFRIFAQKYQPNVKKHRQAKRK